MYVTVLSEIHCTHLDPRIGFPHTTNCRRTHLNLTSPRSSPIVVMASFLPQNRGALKAKRTASSDPPRGSSNEKAARSSSKPTNSPKETVQHPRSRSRRNPIGGWLELYKLEKHLLEDEPRTSPRW